MKNPARGERLLTVRAVRGGGFSVDWERDTNAFFRLVGAEADEAKVATTIIENGQEDALSAMFVVQTATVLAAAEHFVATGERWNPQYWRSVG